MDSVAFSTPSFPFTSQIFNWQKKEILVIYTSSNHIGSTSIQEGYLAGILSIGTQKISQKI